MGVEIENERVTNELDHPYMGGTDDEFTINEVGILNLENMMEAWVFSTSLCKNNSPVATLKGLAPKDSLFHKLSENWDMSSSLA